MTGEVDEYGQPADDTVVVALAGDPLYVGVKLLDQEQHALEDVRLLAPVLPRSKVVGIGRNYAAHAAELGHDLPTEPLMFLKPNTSVVGPGDPIFYPRQTQDLHYEGELAVVIGRICRDVPPEQATDVIHGYTIANDVTARDLQKQRRAVHPGQGLRLLLPARAVDRDRPRPAGVRRRRPVQTHVNGDVAPGRHHGRPDLRHPDADRARVQRHDAAARRRHPHRHPRGCRSHGGR